LFPIPAIVHDVLLLKHTYLKGGATYERY
jgi:hypothetical protein